MLCLSGFELYSLWVPLNDLFQFCAVAVHTSPKIFSCPLPAPAARREQAIRLSVNIA